MPNELKSYNESPDAKLLNDLGSSAVNAGIDAEIVADAVADAVLNKKFWILTHERAALRTTEQRLEWMRGSGAATINLEGATQP
jgi:hypothetical protein